MSQSLISIDDTLRALAEARTPEQLIGLAKRPKPCVDTFNELGSAWRRKTDVPKIRLRQKESSANILRATHSNSNRIMEGSSLGRDHPRSATVNNALGTAERVSAFEHRCNADGFSVAAPAWAVP